MNNTTLVSCPPSPLYTKATEAASYSSYFIITPIYFVLGLVGHSLSLLAFRKQAKKEKAYIYQICSCVGETLEIITFTLFSFSARWWGGGQDILGVYWFASKYALMWYTTIAPAVVNGFITSSLLLYFAMSADRLYALWKPIAYKNIKGNFRHYATIGACFVLGIGTSVYDVFRFKLVWSDDRWLKKVDTTYTSSALAKTMANVQTVLRIAAFGCLILANIFLIKGFRSRMLKNKVNPGGTKQKKDQLTEKRKEAEKTLFILTVTQSVLEGCVMLPLTLFFLLTYSISGFSTCYTLMGPINDCILQLAQMANFYVLLIVSKPFRTMVSKVLPFKQGSASANDTQQT